MVSFRAKLIDLETAASLSAVLQELIPPNGQSSGLGNTSFYLPDDAQEDDYQNFV